MDLRKVVPLLVVGMCQVGSAQTPTYGIGRTPTADEIRRWDISISPNGTELPPGHGTAKEGAPLYVQKGCGGCHGRNGNMAQAPTLIKSDGTMKNQFSCLQPCVNDNNVMALHPSLHESLAKLRDWGVQVLYGDHLYKLGGPGQTDHFRHQFPWRRALQAVSNPVRMTSRVEPDVVS